MEKMIITNDPQYAKYAEDSGVQIIFLDLETEGKIERQGHLDTVISQHSIDDTKKISEVLSKSKLMVRVNPYSNNSKKEIEKAINYGADIIMLPMFRSYKEVKLVEDIINGRAEFIPLLETKSALDSIDEIIEKTNISQLHIGLNDLHLDMNESHMLNLLENGVISSLTEKLKNLDINFGVGGIAGMSSGDVCGLSVLAKYIELGSERVILSRAFHKNYKADLVKEINIMENELQNLKRDKSYLERMSNMFKFEVGKLNGK
jgi:2-keto-3-deoxy-L-rhamnonate aldolase RhmA